MFKKTIFLSLLSISLLFQACTEKEQETKQIEAAVVTNKYVLTSTDNKQYIVKKELNGFILEKSKDKILILDIFATWCPPCQASASHLTSLQKKFKDDLLVIGVTIEDGISNADLDDFKKEFNAQYPIVNSSQNRLLVNEVASVLELGQRFPIPIMVMYKDGVLVNHYIGEVQEEFVESDIKRALGK